MTGNTTLFEEEQIMKAYTKSMVEQGLEQGRKQGLEQGRKQGLEQGIEQGLEQGICILVETLKGLGQSRDFILNKLMSEYGLSEAKARKYL